MRQIRKKAKNLPVNPINTSTLMVATEEEEVLGVLDLVRKKQTDGLQRLLAAVHVISEEQVI